MQKLKIAVWNIRGPSIPLKVFSGSEIPKRKEPMPKYFQKIENFEKKVKPDIAFYLEAPDGTAGYLPILIGNRKFHWAEAENPRGVLVVRYRENCMIDETKLKLTDPKSDGKSAVRIVLTFGGHRFQITGVWTKPQKSGQEDYLECLRKIMRDLVEKEENGYCIIAGDTNVNLDSNVKDGGSGKETCRKRRAAFTREIREHYGLKLANPEEHFTLDHGGLFQCDLLMASGKLLDHSDPAKPKLDILSVGSPAETLSRDLELYGSDHIPLIFEISVPDPEPGQ